MKSEHLFNAEFIAPYLIEFRASSISNIRKIQNSIESLIKELKSGKINSSKEEELKSRFICTFFGDILGYNYGNPKEWLIREEPKSKVDGKKPDAALGYFTKSKIKDDVRVIIEIKDAKTDLDKPQNRIGNQTPVEQAFSYVSKMGGNCNWVVVSNFIEIRFYPALDCSKYQKYILEELSNPNVRNELLFLFHKERLFEKEIGHASTEKLFSMQNNRQKDKDIHVHIIDQMYYALEKFRGLEFVDPNYLSSLFPFNILKKHVWHYYANDLFTINKKIYAFLNEITISEGMIVFSDGLMREINDCKIDNAEEKVIRLFYYLNQCIIFQLTAVKDYNYNEIVNKNVLGFTIRHPFPIKNGEDGIVKNIFIDSKNCDCVCCKFHRFDFAKIHSQLKANEGDTEHFSVENAYGHYLFGSNDFKTCYIIYKEIASRTKESEGAEIEYFFAKYNIVHLHNLLSVFPLKDNEKILDDIKSVDLGKIIYDELEFQIDNDVRNYLIEIKEDRIIQALDNQIDAVVSKISDLKLLYEDGNHQSIGPDLSSQLAEKYYLLYSHINRNFIIYDVFSSYKKTVEKTIKGLLLSYQTPEFGLKEFNDFFLLEAIMHIYPSKLQKLLKEIVLLKTTDNCIDSLLNNLNNLLSSFIAPSIFGELSCSSFSREIQNNFHFKKRVADLFSNMFTVLSRLSFEKDKSNSSFDLLVKFLKIETILSWTHLKELGAFIYAKGFLFESSQLKELIKTCIKGIGYGKNKYNDLLHSCAQSMSKHFPDDKFNDLNSVEQLILNCISDDGLRYQYDNLVYIIDCCAERCQERIFEFFESKLDLLFNEDLYEKLLHYSDYDYTKGNYFEKYIDFLNTPMRNSAYKFGKLLNTDVIFFGFACIIYRRNIDFKSPELQVLKNLNDFERWLINPFDFDYSLFQALWLTDINSVFFLDKLKEIPQILKAVDVELSKKYNAKIAEIKYQYLE